MKNFKTLQALVLSALLLLGCSKSEDTDTVTPEDPNFKATEVNGVVTIEGTTSKDYTFRSDKKYLLKGFVKINEGATLTIEPGTVIKGDKDSKGSLIIERGGKINAAGTASNPIVFTSNQPVGKRSYGDWGGIIICGKAPINQPGGEAEIEGGVGSRFGGSNAADNSGVLKYVRIEYPGIAFQPNNEINGLTMAGVGNGTTIDYVQVSYSGDDSFEWFGGTVNAKHLVAYRGWDDDFDTDNGFSGKIQYAVSLRDAAIADQSGSNGFESDNDASGSDATPQTRAVFSNVSLFGPSGATVNSLYKRAAHLRRNTGLSIHNSVLAGAYPDAGLLIEGTKTESNAQNNTLQFKNNVLAGQATALKLGSGSMFPITTWFNTASFKNTILTNAADLKIADAFNLSSPGFTLQSGSSLSTGADFTGLDAFFDKVSFKGAFGAENWTSGWANFNPGTQEYK